jgi:outer membrane protein assembly factor BamB
MEMDGRSLIIVWSWRELTVYDAMDGNEVTKFAIPGEFRGVRVATPIVDGDRLYVFDVNQVCAIDIRAMLASKPPMLWTTGMKHRGPDTATAVPHAGHLFMVSDAGDVSCLDARDGRLVWQRRLRARSASYCASPIVVGDDLLISDTKGMTYVLSTDAVGETRATNDLGSPIYASVAPVDGRLYIRTTGSLWCIGTRPAKSLDVR